MFLLVFVQFGKLTHRYCTRANQKRKMDQLKQENRELREEVSTLKDSLERLSAMMESLVAAQNQPPSPPPSPVQRTIISEIVSVPVSVAPAASVPQHSMPPDFPWSMLLNFVPEGYHPPPPPEVLVVPTV